MKISDLSAADRDYKCYRLFRQHSSSNFLGIKIFVYTKKGHKKLMRKIIAYKIHNVVSVIFNNMFEI